MINKLKEGFNLLKNNLFLLSFLILTINIVQGFFHNVFYSIFVSFLGNLIEDSEIFKIVTDTSKDFILVMINSVVDSTLYPFYITAILSMLSRAKQGLEVNYFDTVSFSCKKGTYLLLAWFIANIYITLSLMTFLINYVFIDEVIVLENQKIELCRKRSTELSKNLKLEIIYFLVVYFMVFIFSAFLDSALDFYFTGFFKSLTRSILVYATYFIYSLLYSVKYLYYLDAKKVIK